MKNMISDRSTNFWHFLYSSDCVTVVSIIYHNCTFFFFFSDSTIDAPPSFKPAKKYSDISGLLVCTRSPTLTCVAKDLLGSSSLSVHSRGLHGLKFQNFTWPMLRTVWSDAIQAWSSSSNMLPISHLSPASIYSSSNEAQSVYNLLWLSYH